VTGTNEDPASIPGGHQLDQEQQFEDATSYQVRDELQTLIERDLLGPWNGEHERCAPKAMGPRERYLVGMLGPKHSCLRRDLQGAAGAITDTEPAAAFRSVPGIQLWHWPAAARTEQGAKMHAKIAIADRQSMLVTSANLTQSGTTANIEAGILIHGGHAPTRAAEHISHLIATETLTRLYPSPV
jgi:phosphatidylserine/phosphatidylglycerophosphate/cardiolipin synthase-like enzyme